MRYQKLLIVLVILYGANLLKAQDIHFTQFYNSPLTLNPGLTGIFKGDQRFIGVYRNQWYAANSQFSTFFGSFDTKYYNRKLGKAFLGLGGGLYYDRAGDSKLTNLNVSLNGSYTYAIDRENLITGGLLFGIAQRSFDYEGLLWNEQFDGEQVDPSIATGEQFDENGYLFEDIGLGINYRGQKLGSRSTLDIGAGFYHLTSPNQSFADRGDSRLNPRMSFYLIQYLQTSPVVDLYWNGLTQIQDKYLEALAGFGARWHLDQRRGKELAVQMGMSYRFNEIGDAANLNMEAHYLYWRLGLSYDMNVSGYSEATRRNGGPEVSLRYVIHFVKPIPVFKVCPII